MSRCEHGLELPPREWPDTPASPFCRVCWISGKFAVHEPTVRVSRAGLGTILTRALKKFGITEERVTAWLGRPCGCAERREKLNALTWWAIAAVAGRATAKHLEEILS